MKILKLEFRNINSLKGSHEIDFTKAPFTGSSLFAITGPTGSGKSTILDVISLALFNRIPRLDKISTAEINKTGAILTRNQHEAMAAVTYESRSGKYRSEWSISTARTGNLRDYEMQLSEADTGEMLPLKKSEVPQQNELLIGLNYNQFIKSVLLAQGEFAQFLKARKEERGELLEKITGTGIYRQLGRAAFDRFREVSSEIELQQQHITQIRGKLLEEHRKEEIQGELTEKEEINSALEKAITGLKKQLEIKEQVKKREGEIKLLEEEKSSAVQKLERFENDHGQPLLQHEKVRNVSEQLREWHRLKQEVAVHRKELVSKQAEETKNLEELKNCLQTTQGFTKSEVNAENIAERLQEFRNRVSALDESIREKRELHRNLKTRMEACLGEIAFPWKKDPEEQRIYLEEIRTASTVRLDGYRKTLQVNLENLDEEKQALRQRLQLTRRAQMEALQQENLSQELLRLRTEAAKTATEKKDLPARQQHLKQQIETSGKDLEILQLKKEKQVLLATMEEHRRKLKEGEPCHLCGSVAHPYADHLPEAEDSLDGNIRETHKLLRELNHQLSTVTASLEEMEKRTSEINASITKHQGDLKERSSKFDQQFGHLKSADTISWEQQGKRLEGQLMDLEDCEKEQRLNRAVTTALPLQLELTAVLTEGMERKANLDELYSGKSIHDDCQKLQNNWLRFTEQQNSLRKRIAELKEEALQKEKQFNVLVQELGLLSEQGFLTLEEAFAALLPEQRYQELQGQRDQFRTVISRQETSIKLLRVQYEELRTKDVEEKADMLHEQLDIHSSQWKAVKEDCEELRRLQKNDVDLHGELQQLQQKIADREKQIKRWRLLNELIGDSKGKKFNDFAQDLSLGQLLHLANNRLKDLSDRYRIDKPIGDEDDGLVAIDEHMGGQRRSVKTLSGGETFILSLSLALALSDLASRNVEINSLFIDEGFGTLDPETLDQTLDTLEKLQAESQKTIGIISHVDSLKERIGTQIRLKRNGQGYSTLDVSRV